MKCPNCDGKGQVTTPEWQEYCAEVGKNIDEVVDSLPWDEYGGLEKMPDEIETWFVQRGYVDEYGQSVDWSEFCPVCRGAGTIRKPKSEIKSAHKRIATWQTQIDRYQSYIDEENKRIALIGQLTGEDTATQETRRYEWGDLLETALSMAENEDMVITDLDSKAISSLRVRLSSVSRSRGVKLQTYITQDKALRIVRTAATQEED